MSTAVIWDPRYLQHNMGTYHPESPKRLEAVKQVLDRPAWKDRLHCLTPRPAGLEEIALVHDFEYVRKIEQTAGHTVQLDADTSTSPESWEAARLAVGGMLTCVDYVLESPQRNAFAFVRPPGHHAERERAMGFCLFNNVAVAAEYALRRPGVKKVLIIDFDVHHGNGTQWAFYERADVFYISTHRYPFYPGTGARREEGRGRGKGYTLNIPFSGGEGDEEYARAFEREIIPVSLDFAPDVVLVSAGYDAHRRDPLGGMNVTGQGYGLISEKILELAGRRAQGRTVFVLEGGYDLQGLAEGVEASLKALTQSSPKSS